MPLVIIKHIITLCEKLGRQYPIAHWSALYEFNAESFGGTSTASFMPKCTMPRSRLMSVRRAVMSLGRPPWRRIFSANSGILIQVERTYITVCDGEIAEASGACSSATNAISEPTEIARQCLSGSSTHNCAICLKL